LTSGYSFGFEDPRVGRPFEEKVWSKKSNPSDENSRTLWKRTLTEWDAKQPASNNPLGVTRDARVKRSVSIIFENGQALATLNETDYDENGSTDPQFFSHLNPIRQKGYYFKALDLNTAKTADLATIAALFGSGDLASVSETDYAYLENYKARGILGRPTETRVLNPANTSEVLSSRQFVYDEAQYPILDSGTVAGWQDPGSGLRGNVTTTKTLLKDPTATGVTWIETHAQYDNFGNLRKAWDASGDASRFVETIYENTTEKPYKFAYPTKMISPAPDPNDTGHGSPANSEVSTLYDFNTGLVKNVTDANGQVTTTEYEDSMLRPTKVIAPNGAQAISIYGEPDSNGHFPAGELFVKAKKQIDELNWDEAVTKTDAMGRTIETQAKDSQGDVFVKTRYDELGRVTCVSNPYRTGENVYWNRTRYDDQSRPVETYAPVVSTHPTECNGGDSLGTTAFDISTVSGYVGTVVISTDASGRKGRSITNALGQLIRVDESTAFGGTVTNDLGTLAAPHQPTLYRYDALGKMVKVTQGVQNRYFLYDNLGRLLRVKQPEQEANTDLATTINGSDNNTWSAGFTYDVLGNVLTATDANGTVIHNDYDNAGRIKTRSYSNEPQGITTPAVSFYYDGKGLSDTVGFALGKLTKVTNSVSETRYTNFDNMSRVLSSEQITEGQTYPSSYKYNLSGTLIEQTYPSGEIVRNFLESDGDLSRVAVSGHTYAGDFNYTANGGIAALKLGNGLWETAQFNTRQQVTQLGLGATSSNADLWKVDFEYGELQSDGTTVDSTKNTGNIAKQTLTIPNVSFAQTYKYDSLYRLTEAKETTGSQNWIQNFGYDRYGNRTGFNQQIGSLAGNTTPAVSPNTNRFTAQEFVYDKNGNITNDGQGTSSGRSFTFNGDNKQTVVKDAYGAVKGRYFYDGEGKRVKKIAFEGASNEERTIFVYDTMGKLIAEYSNQVSPAPTVSYTTTDHLGSPRVITDKSGTVTSRRDYMPFGEELNAGTPNRTESAKYSLTGDTLRKKFTGYEKDAETGLDFAEARYYQNQHGRFTTIDPLLASGKSANPQTLNRYVYVVNNPILLTDPSGLDPIWTYYTNASGGQSYKMFKSQKEVDEANDLRKTEACKDNPGCFEYKVWGGGNWVLWNNRIGGWLRDDGDIDKFSLQGFGTDEQWNELVSDWYAGKGLNDSWQKIFQIAFENEAATGLDNFNCGVLGGARRIEHDGGIQSALQAAPFVLPITGRLSPAGRNAFAAIEEALPAVRNAVHGNSLSSMRPTWGYKLFSTDGKFLKNGITSAAEPERRYTQSFMADKFMKAEMFPNRRAAYNWEYNQNMVNPGPLNKERYILKTP
jgi:RHS repeat-associated protein